MNMAIPLDADVNYEEDALRYLLRTAVQEYYESLELLREMEEL